MYAFLFALLPVLAAGAPAETEGEGGSPLQLLFPFVIMIVIFYFLIIRPQRKVQRQKREMINSLKKHDEVVTRGGIIGTVIEVRNDRDEVLVEIAKGTRIRLRRPAIEGVFPNNDDSEAKEDRQESR